MLDQFATQAAIVLLNRMLERESWARERLAPFAGRSARFMAAPFAFNIGVVEGGLVGVASGEPDVTIAIDLANVPFPDVACRPLGYGGRKKELYAKYVVAFDYVYEQCASSTER